MSKEKGGTLLERELRATVRSGVFRSESEAMQEALQLRRSLFPRTSLGLTPAVLHEVSEAIAQGCL